MYGAIYYRFSLTTLDLRIDSAQNKARARGDNVGPEHKYGNLLMRGMVG